MSQYGFYFDQTRCTGCYACAIACNDKHNLPVNVRWRRVSLSEQGEYPAVRLLRLSISCMHCACPPCVEACPAAAITKRQEDGIVVVNPEQCLGGDDCSRFCLQACTYGAPQFGAEDNPKMQKCDLCLDLLIKGETPACAAACPMLALEAGTINNIEATHNTTMDNEGLPEDPGVNPSVRFRGQD